MARRGGLITYFFLSGWFIVKKSKETIYWHTIIYSLQFWYYDLRIANLIKDCLSMKVSTIVFNSPHQWVGRGLCVFNYKLIKLGILRTFGSSCRQLFPEAPRHFLFWHHYQSNAIVNSKRRQSHDTYFCIQFKKVL